MDINFNESTHLPIDRPYNYSHNGQNFNALTIGACSYLCGAALKYIDYSRYLPHILIGRFSSLAGNITFFAGQNHEYKNVATTFPFDAFDVVKKICVAANVSNLNYFPHEKRFDNHYQIIIGHDVWIGNGAQIISGVKIGSGAIVGTNAVVAKDIPPYAIAVGNPARVVKYRFDVDTIKKFLAVKWWNWDIKKILENVPLMHDAERFLAEHYTDKLACIPYEKIWGGRQLKNTVQKAGKFMRSWRTSRRLSRSGKESSADSSNRRKKIPCCCSGRAKECRWQFSTTLKISRTQSEFPTEKLFTSYRKNFRRTCCGTRRTSSRRAKW